MSWFLAGCLVLSMAVNVYLAGLITKQATRPTIDYGHHDAEDRAAIRQIALSTLPEPRSHVTILPPEDVTAQEVAASWERGVAEAPAVDPSDTFITDPERMVGMNEAGMPYDPGWG